MNPDSPVYISVCRGLLLLAAAARIAGAGLSLSGCATKARSHDLQGLTGTLVRKCDRVVIGKNPIPLCIHNTAGNRRT